MYLEKELSQNERMHHAPDCVLHALEAVERGEAKAAVFIVSCGDVVHFQLKVGVVWLNERETWRQSTNPHAALNSDEAIPVCATWEERQDVAVAATRTAYRLAMMATTTKGKISLQRYVYD